MIATCQPALGERLRSHVGPVSICGCGAVVDLHGTATRGLTMVPEHITKRRG